MTHHRFSAIPALRLFKQHINALQVLFIHRHDIYRSVLSSQQQLRHFKNAFVSAKSNTRVGTPCSLLALRSSRWRRPSKLDSHGWIPCSRQCARRRLPGLRRHLLLLHCAPSPRLNRCLRGTLDCRSRKCGLLLRL